MTMKDISNVPEWLVWAIFVLLVTISAVLLSGHGANLIAGYNNSSKNCFLSGWHMFFWELFFWILSS